MTAIRLPRVLVPLAGLWQRIGGARRDRRVFRAVLDATLAASVLLVTVLLFGFGYRATREWERSNLESTERRGNEVLMLLGTALERDMRGAFTTVLLPFNVRTLQASSRYNLADRFAVAFARFPYLESFFVWRRDQPLASASYFFNRADQPPPWDRTSDHDDVFPVLMRSNPAAARHVIDQARREGARGVPFAAFDVSVEEVPYQAFVHLLYGGPSLNEVTALVGFTVNRTRLRDYYFQDLIQHLQAVTGDRSLAIENRGRPRPAGGTDGAHHLRGSNRPQTIPAPVRRPLTARISRARRPQSDLVERSCRIRRGPVAARGGARDRSNAHGARPGGAGHGRRSRLDGAGGPRRGGSGDDAVRIRLGDEP